MQPKTKSGKNPRKETKKSEITPSGGASTALKNDAKKSSSVVTPKQEDELGRLECERVDPRELENTSPSSNDVRPRSTSSLTESSLEKVGTHPPNLKGIDGAMDNRDVKDSLNSADADHPPKHSLKTLPHLRRATIAPGHSTHQDEPSKAPSSSLPNEGHEKNSTNRSSMKVWGNNKENASVRIAASLGNNLSHDTNSKSTITPAVETTGGTQLHQQTTLSTQSLASSDSHRSSSREEEKKKRGNTSGSTISVLPQGALQHSSFPQAVCNNSLSRSAGEQGLRGGKQPLHTRGKHKDGGSVSVPRDSANVLRPTSLTTLMAKEEKLRATPVESFVSLDPTNRAPADLSVQLAQKLVQGSNTPSPPFPSSHLPNADFLPAIQRLPPSKVGPSFPASGMAQSSSVGSLPSTSCCGPTAGLSRSSATTGGPSTQDHVGAEVEQKLGIRARDGLNAVPCFSSGLGFSPSSSNVAPFPNKGIQGDSTSYTCPGSVAPFIKKCSFPLDENELIAAKNILPIICCPLQNVGNSCYFNSVIQLLANCQAFVYSLRNSAFARSQRVSAECQLSSSAMVQKKTCFTSGSNLSAASNSTTCRSLTSSEQGRPGRLEALEKKELPSKGGKKEMEMEREVENIFSTSAFAMPAVSTAFFDLALVNTSVSRPHRLPQRSSSRTSLQGGGNNASTEPSSPVHKQFYANVAKLLFLMEFGPDPIENSEGSAMLREATNTTLNTLGLVSSTFAGRSQQDAAEMISTVLSTLEEEGTLEVDVSTLLETFREDYGKIERGRPARHHFFHQVCFPSPSWYNKQSVGFLCNSQPFSSADSYSGYTTSLPRLGTVFSVVGNTTMMWLQAGSHFSSSAKLLCRSAGHSRDKKEFRVDDTPEGKTRAPHNGVEGGMEEEKARFSHPNDPDAASSSLNDNGVLRRSNGGGNANNVLWMCAKKPSIITSCSQDPRYLSSTHSLRVQQSQHVASDSALTPQEHNSSCISGTETPGSVLTGEPGIVEGQCNYWGTNSLHWSKFLSFVEKINYDNEQLKVIVYQRQEDVKKKSASALPIGGMSKSGELSLPECAPSSTCSATTTASSAPPVYNPPKLHFHDVTNVFTGYTVSETICHHCMNASRSMHAFQVLLLDIPSEEEWEAHSKRKATDNNFEPLRGAWHIVGEGGSVQRRAKGNICEKGQKGDGGATSVDKPSRFAAETPLRRRSQNSVCGPVHTSNTNNFRESRGSSQPLTTKDLSELESPPLPEGGLSPDFDFDVAVGPTSSSFALTGPHPLRSYEAKLVDQFHLFRSSPSHSRTSSGTMNVSSTSTVPKGKRSNWRNSLSGFIKSVKKRFYSIPSTPYTLQDCMRHHFAPYYFNSQNLYKCEACGKASEATKREYIAHLPETLFIQMKRFEGGVFSNSKKLEEVEFPISWDPLVDPLTFSLTSKDHVLDLAEFIHPELRDTYRCLEDEEKQIPHSFGIPYTDSFHKHSTSSFGSWGTPVQPSNIVPEVMDGNGSDKDPNAALLYSPPSEDQAKVEKVGRKGEHQSSNTELSWMESPSHLPRHSSAQASNTSFAHSSAISGSQGHTTAGRSYHSSVGLNTATAGAHPRSRSATTLHRKSSSVISNTRPQLNARAPHPVSTYSLVGVINHHGSLSSGHYTTYARKENSDGKSIWVLINDDEVIPVDDSEVGDAEEYILMYRQQPVVKRSFSIENKLQQVARYMLQTVGKHSSFYSSEGEKVQRFQMDAPASRTTGVDDLDEKARKDRDQRPCSSPPPHPEFSTFSPSCIPKNRSLSVPIKTFSTRVYLSRFWLHRVAFLGDPGPIVNRTCYCSDAEKRKPIIPASLFPPETSPLLIKSLRESASLPHVHMVPLEWFYVPVSMEDYLSFFNHYGGNTWVTVEELNEMAVLQESFTQQIAALLHEKGPQN